MKKLYAPLLLVFTSTLIIAQNPSYQQRLFYTCKIWGFIKYFHSNVSTCGVNWDSVLLTNLPLVKAAVTDSEFNNVLDTMLKAAGPMAIAVTPPCDTVPPELSHNLNFGWLNSPMLRNDVQVQLDTIKNNFRPHAECWVQNNAYVNNYIGWLVFPHDSLMLNKNISFNFPDEWHRLLVLFKHWNIVQYFSFNIYVHDIPWDSTLMRNVLAIDNSSNDLQFYIAFHKFVSDMDDTHAQAETYNNNYTFPNPGWNFPGLALEYIPNNYVVNSTIDTGISPGDIITSINGLTTQQWEDSLKPYISASDTAETRYSIANAMPTGSYGQYISIDYKDSLNNPRTLNLQAKSAYYYYYYYPNDTLATKHWAYWSNCNIGYVNVGQVQISDESALESALQSSRAIIFDVRNYPSNTAIWDIINWLFAHNMTVNAKFTIPNVTYPGTWSWATQTSGYNGNPSPPYGGKVIILMNQVTGSDAEYVCQTLHLMPSAVTVGSQTSGADGNVTYYRIAPDVHTGFTTLGWFLPNGDSTQRVGIKPDSIVYPTSVGLRHHRDELLEKALQIADCPLVIQNISKPVSGISVFPNPNNGIFTLEAPIPSLKGENYVVGIYNMLGSKVASLSTKAGLNQIDLSFLSSGIYMVKVENSNLTYLQKLAIIH